MFAGEGLPARDLIEARVCEHLWITGRTMLAVVLPEQGRGGLPTVRSPVAAMAELGFVVPVRGAVLLP